MRARPYTRTRTRMQGRKVFDVRGRNQSEGERETYTEVEMHIDSHADFATEAPILEVLQQWRVPQRPAGPRMIELVVIRAPCGPSVSAEMQGARPVRCPRKYGSPAVGRRVRGDLHAETTSEMGVDLEDPHEFTCVGLKKGWKRC